LLPGGDDRWSREWREAHKGALSAVFPAWRGGARTGTDGSCYNNRSMHYELDNLRCPLPGVGA
jgi:hypothetical protein